MGDAAKGSGTPAVPGGWREVDASLCGVDFTVHFKVGDDGECAEWRIYPAGTSADIAHAVGDGDSLYLFLDGKVEDEIDRMDIEEAHHAAEVPA